MSTRITSEVPAKYAVSTQVSELKLNEILGMAKMAAYQLNELAGELYKGSTYSITIGNTIKSRKPILCIEIFYDGNFIYEDQYFISDSIDSSVVYFFIEEAFDSSCTKIKAHFL